MPSNVKIVGVEPIKADTAVKAGSKVILACVSSNSNPESQITWFKDYHAI